MKIDDALDFIDELDAILLKHHISEINSATSSQPEFYRMIAVTQQTREEKLRQLRSEIVSRRIEYAIEKPGACDTLTTATG